MPFRLHRFLDNLRDQTSSNVQEKLLQNFAPFGSLMTSTQTAEWIKRLMDDLSIEIGVENAKVVMEACGRQCIGSSVIEKARLLSDSSHDIDELLIKLNQAHIGGGKLRRENDVIYACYERCYCGSVSKTQLPISTVYCECSCGWYKKLFEAVIDKPVRVELIDSIIHGADICQFIIYL